MLNGEHGDSVKEFEMVYSIEVVAEVLRSFELVAINDRTVMLTILKFGLRR